MKTAIIVVLFNTPIPEKQRLEREVREVFRKDYILYWIDNTGTGRGFAGGVNEGIKKGMDGGCDRFVILSPDISFSSVPYEKWNQASETFDVWGYTMRQDNTVFYGGQIEKWRMSGGLVNVKPNKRFVPVDFVTGSFMGIKRKVIETIGYFDETYFMYYEDVDYCLRAKRAGLSVGIDSDLTYDHFEISKTNEQKDFLLAKNRLRFLFTYGTPLQKVREIIRSPRTLFEERKLIFGRIRQSPFLVNFFSLNASSLLVKGLNFILFLFLIRTFNSADYGVYILVWAHITLLSPLVDFGTTSYGIVYMSKDKKMDITSLFSLRLFLSVIVWILTIILAFVFGFSGNVLLYVFLTSVVLFSNMTSGTLLILLSNLEKVYINSLLSSIHNIILIAGLILAVVFTKNLTVLFIVLAIQYGLYTLVNAFFIKRFNTVAKIVFRPQEWLGIIKKSYVFVLIGFFAGIYFKIDVFLLNFLKGQSAVGIYSSGYKFFEALILIASSYNTVSAPVLSKTISTDKSQLFPKVKKHMFLLLGIGIGVVGVTELFGPLFLPYILKGNYAEAVTVVRIVICALPFILYNSILLNLLYVAEKASLVIWIFLIQSVLNIVLNIVLIPHFSFIGASYVTVLSEIGNTCMLQYLVFSKYRKEIFS